LHGAIGAQAVRAVRQSDDATARIWRADPATCAVSVVDVQVQPVLRAVVGEWTFIVDAWLLQHLAELRISRLPNETGGVFLGAYDLPRKTVYVVDTIPSPPDSIEWPTLYIRGCDGLLDRVKAVSELTVQQLEYIGEWHSHPDQCGCNPSADDMKVFSWMTDRMSAAGLPALMAIIGQHGSSAWFLGRMESEPGWNAKVSDFERGR
jgi:integrative and conjugative element protein (TIGR02256 family)